MACHCCTQPDPADLLAAIQLLHVPLHRLETVMATAREQLESLNAKVDDLLSDARAALELLRAERENLTPESQAALDTLTSKLDAFDAEIGDADGSENPATPPSDEPSEPTPTPDF